MLLNDDIEDAGKSDGKCSPDFVTNQFSELFLHQYFLLNFQDLHKS